MDVNEKYLREDEREIGPRWKRNAFFLPPRAGTDIALLLARICEARARIEQLEQAVYWALGYTDFRQREEGEGAYWWRSELRAKCEPLPAPRAAELEKDGGQG